MKKQTVLVIITLFLICGKNIIKAEGKVYPISSLKVTEGIFQVGIGTVNLVVFTSAKGTLLSDCGFIDSVDSLKSELENLNAGPVKYVINTHWHHDHAGGNWGFANSAQIISHQKTREILGLKNVSEFWGSNYPAFPDSALPTITFENDMTLNFGNEVIRLKHYPGGHGPDDICVYFEHAKVLHMGDLLFSFGFPAIDFEKGGSVQGYIEILERILHEYPKDVKIIAGHGPVFNMSQLKDYMSMLKKTFNIVRAEIGKGKTLQQLKNEKILNGWESYGNGYFTCEDWIEIVFESLTFKNKTKSNEHTYLHQNEPGELPQVFYPDVISTDSYEGCSGWGPDLKFFIFQRWETEYPDLYIIDQTTGEASQPTLIDFFSEYKISDFTLSPDGKSILFASSNLIRELGSGQDGHNIWISEKQNDGWSTPRYFKNDINTKYHDSYPCLAANGNIYFFSRRPGGIGDSDLYLSEFKNGKYQTSVNLGAKINTPFHDWDPYVSPDESYLIYCSKMPRGKGEDDLYISFKNTNSSWGNPIAFGEEINTKYSENRPYVSPDGQFFFFTRNIDGDRDIYWVSTKIFEKLKKEK